MATPRLPERNLLDPVENILCRPVAGARAERMRYLALCCDYDGTLATHGKLLPDTVEALEALIASGRRLLMVTGRELDDLQRVCDRLDLFEYVVAENGALLYHPATRAEKTLAAAAAR